MNQTQQLPHHHLETPAGMFRVLSLSVVCLLLCLALLACPSLPGPGEPGLTCIRDEDCPQDQRCGRGMCVAASGAQESAGEAPPETPPKEPQSEPGTSPDNRRESIVEDGSPEVPSEGDQDGGDAGDNAPPDDTADNNPPEPHADDAGPEPAPDCTPQPEVCDGKDNDCNGMVDDHPSCRCTPGETRRCYTGAPSDADRGQCGSGLQSCAPNGIWSTSCSGEKTPSAEVCNNQDDDCDGQVDNLPLGSQSVCTPTSLPGKARCTKGYDRCDSGKKSCQPVHISPLALPATSGSGEGYVYPCKQAKFIELVDMVMDRAGNLYVSDAAGHHIRKITPDGTVTRFAGGTTTGKADGPAENARFNRPIGLAINGKDEIFVADTNNHKIRKINFVKDQTCGGTSRYTGYCVTTYAGTGFTGKADGPLGKATFHYPYGVALTDTGTMFVSEHGNHAIRKLDQGQVVTFAGTGNSGRNDGQGTTARFSKPSGMVWDVARQLLFVADSDNHAIRAIDLQATVSTFAGGNGQGNNDGPKSQAKFNRPIEVALSAKGELLVSDTDGHTVRLIDKSDMVSRYVGTPGRSGYTNGTVQNAALQKPAGLLIDPQGRLLIAESSNHSIRSFHDGVVRTFAGIIGGYGRDDGQRRCASIGKGGHVILGPNGDLYISSLDRHVIYRLSKGFLELFAGREKGRGHKDGNRYEAMFNAPVGLAFDAKGNLFVADSGNHRIRMIDPMGVVSTVAGTGSADDKDNRDALKASFREPWGLAFDASGTLYISDRGNHRIRLYDGKEVKTLAGSSQGYNDNRDHSKVKFNQPAGILFDSKGTLYVADVENHRIRVVDTKGATETYAGNGYGFNNDQDPLKAKFIRPTGLFWSPSGDLMISAAYLLRRIDATTKEVTSYLGSNNNQTLFRRPIPETSARFRDPGSAVFRADGTLVILDTGNQAAHTIPPCPP